MADLYSGRQKSTPTTLSSRMNYGTLVSALNRNFRAINNQVGKTTIINDGDDPRIIFGKLPDGTFGLVISETGTDVTTLFNV